MNISQQLIANERARGDCFKLLAASFYQPQKETFLREGLFGNLSQLLKKACPDAAAFSRKMERAVLTYSNDDLLVDYAKLFVGPYELIAPPYGSVYLDKSRKVMGDSTIEVIKMYREEGLSIDENFRELPDHIAVELEFMYYLIFKEIAALENSDNKQADHYIEAQKRFHQMFLAPWVRQFCDKITEGTDNEFYTALAKCLSAFVLKSTVPEDLKAINAQR